MRRKRFPKIYKDYLPSAGTRLPSLSHMPKHVTLKETQARAKEALAEEVSRNPPIPSPSPPPRQTHPGIAFDTQPDEYGLYRHYLTMPSHDPDELKDLFDLCDSIGLESTETLESPDPNKIAAGLPLMDLDENWGPFENETVFNLMNWQLTGSNMKSIGETNRLIHEVIQHPSFDKSHLDGFEAARNANKLDSWAPDEAELGLAAASDWNKSSVKIRVPCDGVKCPEDDAPEFEVQVYTREITDVITNIFQEPGFNALHLTPFTQWWKPSDGEDPVQVYGEMYTSEAMIEADLDIQSLVLEEHAELPRVVVPVMIYTDSTHVAQFGDASLWPGYVSIGNQSKYERAKPSTFSNHHIAYFPLVCGCFSLITSC
jgi:hypothetical protein